MPSGKWLLPWDLNTSSSDLWSKIKEQPRARRAKSKASRVQVPIPLNSKSTQGSASKSSGLGLCGLEDACAPGFRFRVGLMCVLILSHFSVWLWLIQCKRKRWVRVFRYLSSRFSASIGADFVSWPSSYFSFWFWWSRYRHNRKLG